LVQAEVTKVIQASIYTTDCVTFDEEDDDAMTMDVPFRQYGLGLKHSEVLYAVQRC
jgi:hypothetical protein